MKPETLLDYAVFQLSPKRSHCELFVSSDGNTEKVASGLVKPFVTHLKVAEEQVALAVQSIKLKVDNHKNAEAWFSKGTLERFVRFVSTPEILELVNTFDTEMSQLEAARKIYSQGVGDQHGSTGWDGTGITSAADATKRELLRAIDVRLVAVRQDLTIACSRASAAGFNAGTVSELQLFADQFGAHRLNEACAKFISVCQRRVDLISPWKLGVDDRFMRSSVGSDMSIDDPAEDHNGSHVNPRQNYHATGPETDTIQASLQQHHIDQSKLSTCQQPKFVAPSSTQRTTNEKDEEVSAENEKKQDSSKESPPIQASQPGRRLSVQDRINLFENKQKETSGGKPIVGKSGELRRLSSDVSSAPAVVAEKAVLKRWSGASDMSIDLSGEKKDYTESPLSTPTLTSSVSQTKSTIFPSVSKEKNRKGLNDTTSSVKIEVKSDSDRVGDFGLKDQGNPQDRGTSFSVKEEEVESKGWANLKEQSALPIHLNEEQVGVSDQGVSQGNNVHWGIKDHGDSGTLLTGFSNWQEDVAVNNQAVAQTQIGASVSSAVDVASDSDSANIVEDVKPRDLPATRSRFRSSKSHSRSLSGQLEGGLRNVQTKGMEQLASQPQWKSFNAEVEETGTKNLGSSEKQSNPGDSRVQKMKFQKPISAGSEQIKKSQGGRDEGGFSYGSSKPIFPGKKVLDNQESLGTISVAAVEQVQRVRQSKGNQELNDELKMKANELEKLFAEHKLRVPGDQSSSARRVKLADVQMEHAVSMDNRKPAEIASSNLSDRSTLIVPTDSSSIVAKLKTSPEYGDILRQNFSEIGFSSESRGKFYESYMQKRDAKLREEWGSKRVEKESKMKAMQDSLEQSRAVMKAKLSGVDGQDSVSSAFQRAEKLRSFNVRSRLKREHSVDSNQGEEDGDLSEVVELKSYEQDRLSSEPFVGDSAFRITQSKKIIPNRNLSSSTPRTVAAPASRLAGKASNSGPGRRRAQSENPLAQSVPNFLDFKKENTKPSPGVSKMTTRSQVRNYARSKSTVEDISLAKEEKSRRSQSLRKSSASTVEFKDPLNSDGVEQGIYDKFAKNVDTKPFLRKGSGTGSGAGVSISKLKASMASESYNDEESDELAFEEEDTVDRLKEEEEEDLQTLVVEEYATLDNGKPRLSQEFGKLDNSWSENGDSLRSLSQVDPASVAEIPTIIPSTFHTLGSLQDSPGESPMSWNSRLHNPFSYPHETSDIDASVDSPIGSPASWNFHSMTQTEADAARMRKKWGSAQKPILVASSSHTNSRKDVTKGFKRLLKFGRKTRGSESLVDWISATTSEGDDETEDGRDPASRSSEDLRKSRMGYLQGHPSDDGFNESELFNEQVQELRTSIPAPPVNFKMREDHIFGSSLKAPRSFFSLSSFRSKGSDSKPR